MVHDIIPELTMTQAQLDKLKGTLRNPHNLRFELPGPEVNFFRNLSKTKISFELPGQVDAGLLFPPPTFIKDIVNYFGIPLYQLAPSALRRAFAFHILLSHHGVRDTAPLFFQTQTLKKTNMHYNFSSRKKYPTRFLSSLNSNDMAFLPRYCWVYTMEGDWETYYGLSALIWHPARRSNVPQPPSPPSAYNLEVIDKLNCSQENRIFPCKKLTDNNSALAASGLSELFPVGNIGNINLRSWHLSLQFNHYALMYYCVNSILGFADMLK